MPAQVRVREAQRSIDDLLSAARVALNMDLAFLSHIEDGEQHFEYVENASGSLRLDPGARVPASAAYCAVMLAGEIPNAVPDLRSHPVLGKMPVTSELGVGAYCGVPVRLPDGTLYGTLCGLDGGSRPDLSADQVTVLTVISTLLGEQLARLQVEQKKASARRDELMAQIAPGRLSIVVQPIVDVTTTRTVGVEALSRFRGDERVPQRPDLVFAEAARLGLGSAFEVAALSAALDLLPQLPPETYLSVNLSADTLCDASAQHRLAAAPLSRVVLELTEHEAVEDYDRIVGALTDLRTCGLRLAIDDVGAGFSSLRHILRLTPDLIKMDISLTRSVDRDPARRALAAGLVGVSAELGASLVAEGVETTHERDALQGLGVRLMQGYLLGRPAPVEAGAPPPR